MIDIPEDFPVGDIPEDFPVGDIPEDFPVGDFGEIDPELADMDHYHRTAAIFSEISKNIIPDNDTVQKLNTLADFLAASEAELNDMDFDNLSPLRKAKKEVDAIDTHSAALSEFKQIIGTQANRISSLLKQSAEMKPYIYAAVEEENKERQRIGKENLSPEMIYSVIPLSALEGETIENNFLSRIYRRAKDLSAVPREVAQNVGTVDFPVDKVNSSVWSLLEEIKAGAQLAIATEKAGSKKEATVIYSIDFDELDGLSIPAAKKLNDYDKRVMLAAEARRRSGNEHMSISMIAEAMGYTSRPDSETVKKIDASLTKMGTGRMYLDNTAEIGTNKGYEKFVYDGPLLPFERVSVYINNQLCESAIHLFREPPLISFARSRNQITTIPLAVLQSPVSKTDSSLRLENYLIERIARIKRGKSNNKLLYSTIFERCEITRNKDRAKDKIRRYMDHYTKTGFIKSYEELKDGIAIKY